jgi:hypothetical protein
MDLKQEFVNACNNLNGIEFMNAAAKYLQVVSSKDELNDFVKIFGQVSKIKSIEKSAELESLCALIRDKVYAILIANGEVPENTYIYLYDYFAVCELPEDARFAAYEQFVDQNLYSDGISDLEKVYLIVLRFFASMANSKKDAFEKFLLSTMRLNILDVGSISFSTFVSEYLDSSKVEIETVLDVLKKLWDKDFYFSLDKTQRRSTFNWSLHSLWLAQKYFNHSSWVSLYEEWKAILYEHIARDECDEAMYVHFFIFHKMGNSFRTQDEWKMFNDDIDRPASEYYKAWAERANLPKCKNTPSEGKKIIGFLWDRLVENSPFKVAYSLWKALYESVEFRANYEIKIYVMSYFEKSTNDQKCVDMIEKLGIEVFDGADPFYAQGIYHSHLEKALYIRQKMMSDGVDIMMHGSCYDINDFLVSSRVAPKQIFWSHGNHEYDIKEIDKKITHCALDGCTYSFEPFTVLMNIETFYNPHRELCVIEQERARYPKDTFILGVIGRLVKVDSDEYLQTVAEVMRQNPNTIFIAAGSGNIDNIRAKVEKLGISDRFYMPGHVDPHVYGHIIDLWMDTFPLEGGEAISEYAMKQKALICMLKPNKFDCTLSDVDKKEYKSLCKRYDYRPYFITLDILEVERSHALGKVALLLTANDDFVYVSCNIGDANCLSDEFGIKANRVVVLDEKHTSREFVQYVIDAKISLFGNKKTVNSVKISQFYDNYFRAIPFNWVDILYDNKDSQEYAIWRLRLEKCNIDGNMYSQLTNACTPNDYISKVNRLILNSELRNTIGLAWVNDVKINFENESKAFLKILGETP